ncbi:MAG: Uma2 family endonuclease [Planctomycetes bacterium]|nr:Uma2 family endonuclease [Planctomycetota bacterium]MCB9886919.1 Uma2 family endonuclease [Planctomycetota bacterium]
MARLMTTDPRTLLTAGDRLSRTEFERRYAAMPDLKKAELIEGVVYMGSPVSYRRHGRPERLLAIWLAFYEVMTPGVEATGNTTLRLDLDNEPQPDLMLRVPERRGGRSRIAADGFVEGPPELVIEVAASSVSYDLHQKLHVYRRSGVTEYLVHRVDDGAIDWFRLEEDDYVPLVAADDGMLRSTVFPGLWLPVRALLDGNVPGLRAAVESGCASLEHRQLCQRLASV